MTNIKRYTGGVSEATALQDIVTAWQEDDDFWPYESVLEALQRPQCRLYYVDEGQQWPGLVLLNLNIDTCDLLYIYTRADARRRGLARELLEFAAKELRLEKPIPDVILEVKRSNEVAQQFYLAHGMKKFGMRPRYYGNGEDALIFRWQL